MKKLWVITGLVIFLGGAAWGVDYTWDGNVASGVWSDANGWYNNALGAHNNGYPVAAADTATITSGTVTLDNNYTVTTVTVNNGTTLGLNTFTLTAGTITNNGAITTVSGTLSSNGTVSGTGVINGGTLTLSGSGTFTLTNASNDITSLQTTGTAPQSINYSDANDFSAGPINTTNAAGRSVNLTAGGAITQGGAITTRDFTVQAGGAITLNSTATPNSVTTLNVTGTGGAVQFTNNQALTIAGITGGTYAVTITTTGATSDITQSAAITTTGTLTLNSGRAITLNSGTNAVATLNVTGAGGAVEFTNNRVLAIAGVSGLTGGTAAAQNVTITTTGTTPNITQSGPITTTGTLALNSGGAITLTNPGNNVVTLNVTGAGGAVEFTNNRVLSIAGITGGANNINITTTGATSDITQSAAITTTGTLALNSGGVITLTNAGNSVATLNVTGTGGTVLFTDNRTLGIAGITAGVNNVTITTTGTTSNITQTGPITTTGTLALSSTGAITLNTTTNAISTVGVTTSTSFTFRNSVALTTNAINTGNGAIDISNSNTISVNGNLTTTNTILLQTNNTNNTPPGSMAGNNNITFSAVTTNASKLTVVSGNPPVDPPGNVNDPCGVVSINGNVTVRGTASAESILIQAGEVRGSGSLTATNGTITFAVDGITTVLGNVSPGPTVSPRHGGATDLIYYTDSSTGTGLPVNAVKVRSDSQTGNFSFSGFRNVYLANVSDGNSRTVSVSASGIIEFYNYYTYTGSNTNHLPVLSASSFQFYEETIPVTGIHINMGSSRLLLSQGLNILQGDLSIKAANIQLASVTCVNGLIPNLTLESTDTTGTTITVSGAIGAASPGRFGDIAIKPAAGATASFSGSITAKSYTQTTGSATFSAAVTQNYDGIAPASTYAFQFSGASVTINGPLTTSYTAGDGGQVYINNSTMTLANTITASGSFIKDGTGTANIGSGGITANHPTAANAVISFASPMTLTGDTLLKSNGTSTGGEIDLQAISSNVAVGSLTIENGTGTVNLSGDVSVNGSFIQNGTGAVNFTGNSITTVNTTKTNAIISFASALNNTPAALLSVPFSTGGKIELKAGQASASNGTLTLSGGSSANTLEISQDSGTLNSVTIAANSYVAVSSGKTISQGAGLSLTLAAGTTVLDSSGGSWLMGGAAPPASGTTGFTWDRGFAGLNGILILNANTRINTGDFYNDPSHTVTINGANTTISASRHVTIHKSFATAGGYTLLDSTLEMSDTGTTGELRVLEEAGTTEYTLSDMPAHYAIHLPQVDLGHLRITGTASIRSNMYVRGDLTIANGATLYANGTTLNGESVHIFLFPLTQTTPGNTWNQDYTGQFIYGDSCVEFGNYISSGNFDSHEYSIIGDTTWWYLVCHETMAKLNFSNYDDSLGPSGPGTLGHKVFHRLDVFPLRNGTITTAEADFITLTRLVPYNVNVLTTDPPYPHPWQSPSDPTNFFWVFSLDPNAKLEINHVNIKFSFSRTKIPVPNAGAAPTWKVNAWPYVWIDDDSTDGGVSGQADGLLLYSDHTEAGYYHLGTGTEGDIRNFYNVNWFVQNKFFYSFTEDSNHNGRIDRIRLQSAFDVNGDFSVFEVKVENSETREPYTVTGYRRVEENAPPSGTPGYDLDSIYVFLEEKPYADTGAKLHWWVEKNSSLKDLSTGTTVIGNPRPPPGSIGSAAMDEDVATNTAPPRITYALAVPGRKEIFVQFSGPVVPPEEPSGLTVTSVSTGTLDGANPITPVNSNDQEFLINLTDPLTVSDLAAGTGTFTLGNVRDNSAPALDQHTPGSDYFWFMFPSPKYPQNYNYDDVNGGIGPYVFQYYVSAGGNPPVPPSPPPPVVFPPNQSYNINTGIVVTSVTHRISDMLISVPPNATRTDAYFVWPAWARYDEPANSLAPGNFSPDGFYGQSSSDSGIIWEFNGKKYLEARNTVMQVSLQAGLGTPSLVYAYNVPSDYRGSAMNSRGYGNGNNGLWAPAVVSVPVPPLSENNPPFTNLASYFYNNYSSKDKDDVSGNLYLFNFTAGANGYNSGNTMDFFFHVDGTPADLFAGRLDIAPSAEIPDNWYRLVRPFSFAIHDVTLQRSGVTILNNVINPNKGESTYVDYRLNKGGQVTIQVFTLDGTMVDILYRGRREAGEYRAAWNGTNRGGHAVARGMYFIRVVAPEIDEIRKVMVVK